ncbi:MAG: SAM-dependent methyltransferase [Beijerinckiaceae bacterium]|nr:SAM-dependent methyltransferase [Beijerinckiaceae bacterium]
MSLLGEEIKKLIRLEGPISVERYMTMALSDPRYGYYMTRDPFGAKGDFTTSPEISQIFGELLGLWCADLWLRMGRPTSISLVELGPGRGTLMQDALRAMKSIKGLLSSVQIILVETSPALRKAQQKTLESFDLPIQWQSDVSSLPQLPTLLIANEFFDALPIRQYQRKDEKWHERLVGLNEQGNLILGLAPEAEAAIEIIANEGSVIERNLIGERIMHQLALHIMQYGGAGIAIDYGHTQSGVGETLQALRDHQFVSPLDEPGEADLTTHVDFKRLLDIAQSQGNAVSGPITQADFLEAMGIRQRGQSLIKSANSDQAKAIISAIDRLTDRSPKQMGSLFKVMSFYHPKMPEPAGFSE